MHIILIHLLIHIVLITAVCNPFTTGNTIERSWIFELQASTFSRKSWTNVSSSHAYYSWFEWLRLGLYSNSPYAEGYYSWTNYIIIPQKELLYLKVWLSSVIIYLWLLDIICFRILRKSEKHFYWSGSGGRVSLC